jgi:hypothetical protein
MHKVHALLAVKMWPNDAAQREFVRKEMEDVKKILGSEAIFGVGGKVPMVPIIERSVKRFGFSIFTDSIPWEREDDFLRNGFIILELEIKDGQTKIVALREPKPMQ